MTGTNEDRCEAVTDKLDEAVADVSLDDAIDITLAVVEQASERLEALRADKARAPR